MPGELLCRKSQILIVPERLVIEGWWQLNPRQTIKGQWEFLGHYGEMCQ